MILSGSIPHVTTLLRWHHADTSCFVNAHLTKRPTKRSGAAWRLSTAACSQLSARASTRPLRPCRRQGPLLALIHLQFEFPTWQLAALTLGLYRAWPESPLQALCPAHQSPEEWRSRCFRWPHVASRTQTRHSPIIVFLVSCLVRVGSCEDSACRKACKLRRSCVLRVFVSRPKVKKTFQNTFCCGKFILHHIARFCMFSNK